MTDSLSTDLASAERDIQGVAADVQQEYKVVQDVKSAVSVADGAAPSLLRGEAVRLLQEIENSSSFAKLPLVGSYIQLAKDIESKA